MIDFTIPIGSKCDEEKKNILASRMICLRNPCELYTYWDITRISRKVYVSFFYFKERKKMFHIGK